MITWKKRIRDLQASGLTLREIAEQIGMSQSGVSDIANGHVEEPGGNAALKLDKLHRQRCPDQAVA